MPEISRRDFVAAATGIVAASALKTHGAEGGRRPNVLLIVTDDQGSIDLNCYGANDLVTPNLDALAARGVRFTQFYAAGAVCSPSRAAILTGRYPQHAQMPGNAPHQPGQQGMPADQLTIAEMLKDASYVTGHIGKWHLGYTRETMPNGQGFDYSFGFMGGCIDNYSHFYYWSGPNRHDLWRNAQEVFHEGEYFGDLLVKECNQFIERNKDRPFFLYYAINKPHYPLQGTRKWRERYKNLPNPRGMYAASVSTLDEEIGQVLQKIDDLGLRDDTIVIFQSDQGHSTEERTFGGGGNAGPYRGAKGSFYEGGVRIPAIISWPGHLPAGQVRGQMCTACDWMATIAQLTGASLPKRPIDGRSLVQVIRSADAPATHNVFHWAMGNQWAVRDGNWKLLSNTSGEAQDKLFLANLAEDVGEKKNLASQYPEVVKRLVESHEQWAKDVLRQ